MNQRNELPNLSRVISCDISSLEFSSKTVRNTDPTFDEQVKSIFSALPSLAGESLQNEIIYHTRRSTETFASIYFYISSFG